MINESTKYARKPLKLVKYKMPARTPLTIAKKDRTLSRDLPFACKASNDNNLPSSPSIFIGCICGYLSPVKREAANNNEKSYKYGL